MAGLLDTGNPLLDLGVGLLGASGPSRMPVGLGQVLAGGVQNMQAQADKRRAAELEAMKGLLMQAQIGNYQSEIQQRDAALRKQAEGAAALQNLTAPKYAPGQLGSGSFGVVGNENPTAPAVGGLSNATPEQITALENQYGLKLMDAYKLAKEGFERKPGSTYRNVTTGKDEYIPDPTKGINFQNGQVSVLPGAPQTTAALTLAQKLPEAFAAAAGRVNLRDNPNGNGTKIAVPELSENPQLAQMLDMFRTSPQVAAPAAAPVAAPVQPAAPRASTAMQPGDTDRAAIYAQEVAKLQDQIANPDKYRTPNDKMTDPDGSKFRARAQQDLASVQREMARLGPAAGQTAAPQGAAPQARPTYGMTTDQATAAKVKEAQAVKQVEADVQPMASRQEAIASANYLKSVLDMAIDHPGRETATGLSGTLDPRNYIPGTDAKNFHSVLDQVKGSAFLQAYQQLRGGGAITEVEGKKGTDAIARLNTAQSDDEFKSALMDLRQVVNNGILRAKSGMKASTGATGDFSGDNSNFVPAGKSSAMSSGGWSATLKK